MIDKRSLTIYLCRTRIKFYRHENRKCNFKRCLEKKKVSNKKIKVESIYYIEVLDHNNSVNHLNQCFLRYYHADIKLKK